MERDGVLCHPKLKNTRKWWLYTRSQIEDLIKLATEEGVIDPRKHREFSERFIKQAHLILQRTPQ